MYCKTFSFLVIDTTLVSDNPLHLRKNLPERTWKLIITPDAKIRDEKPWYDINREVKYWRYNRIKLINMNILQVMKYYFLVQVK